MAQFDNMNEQEQMQMLMSQMQDSNLRQSVLQYLNQTAAGLDKNANSKALIETLARESVHNQKSTAIWKSRTKKSVAFGVVAVVLAITVQFLVNYFTNELSKEAHVDKQGAMVSTDGKMVKTQMEEMKVDADGKLLSRNSDAAVKTMPSLARVALASSLPDATLMALDEITVHSDEGYTLQIKVHGFSRIPVLNSRCGNVVHFYTAWKGKVTLDSTDLSFDETTAAEFKNSGFSLATGGRRLAGGISVDGFAKALEGIRGSGKWTCADVPLPASTTFSHSKLTKYRACKPKGDRNNMCFSMYGGLKVGVSVLEGSLLAAVSSQTERWEVQQTAKLFMKSSVTTMNTNLYSVSFAEYAMHPGQQLISISNVASGKRVQFQMEGDSTRSHCVVDKRAKTQNDVFDWVFQYLGTNEEDGLVLRHFRASILALSGESSARFEFWDVAESMQPHRKIVGDEQIVVYDSFKMVSDSDVEAAVESRTGKTMTDLLKCSDRDKQREMRPQMSLFADLSEADANYYAASSSTKSETLARYLDATGDTKAMPDMCYEKCKSLVDAVKLAEVSTDICDGPLEGALECLEQSGLPQCSSTVFSNSHVDECDRQTLDSNNTVRTLEESEDAMEELMLVNETPRRELRIGSKSWRGKPNPTPRRLAFASSSIAREGPHERTTAWKGTHENVVLKAMESLHGNACTEGGPKEYQYWKWANGEKVECLDRRIVDRQREQDEDWKEQCKTEGETKSYEYHRCWEIVTCVTNYQWKFRVDNPLPNVLHDACSHAMESTEKQFSREEFLDYHNEWDSYWVNDYHHKDRFGLCWKKGACKSECNGLRGKAGGKQDGCTTRRRGGKKFCVYGKENLLCKGWSGVFDEHMIKFHTTGIPTPSRIPTENQQVAECLEIGRAQGKTGKRTQEFARCRAQQACTSKYAKQFLCYGVIKMMGCPSDGWAHSTRTNNDIHVEWIELWCVKEIDRVINDIGTGGVMFYHKEFLHMTDFPAHPPSDWVGDQLRGWSFAKKLDVYMKRHVIMKEDGGKGMMVAADQPSHDHFLTIHCLDRKKMGRDFHDDPCDRTWMSANHVEAKQVEAEQYLATWGIKVPQGGDKVAHEGDYWYFHPTTGGVSAALRAEHREETQCFKMGMRFSWEFEKCREMQLSLPYLVEEFRYGDHGEHWAMGEDEKWSGDRCFDGFGYKAYNCVADTFILNNVREHYLKDRYITMMVQLAWGEMNSKPYGGAKMWTYFIGEKTHDDKGWRTVVTPRTIPVVEKELVESWSKRFFDETTQEKFERCSRLQENRWCLERVFHIRTEEVKNFEEDQRTKKCLTDGGTPFTFKYAKCRSIQACTSTYDAKFRSAYEHASKIDREYQINYEFIESYQQRQDRVSSWCGQAIDITQGRWAEGGKRMFNEGPTRHQWARRLDKEMEKKYEDARIEQEELAQNRKDMVGMAEDKQLAEKIEIFDCPDSEIALQGGGFKVETYLADISPELGTSLVSCMKFEVDLYFAFTLEFGWAIIGNKFALYIKLEACVPLELIFGLPPFVSIELCVGGSIEFRLWSDCPQVQGVSMTGQATISITGGVTMWEWFMGGVGFSVTLEIGIEVGVDWVGEVETTCLTFKTEGGRRRRVFARRRMRTTCISTQDCDSYVKGWFSVPVAVWAFFFGVDATVSMEMKYWTKKKNIEYWIKVETNLQPWSSEPDEILNECMYRQQLKD